MNYFHATSNECDAKQILESGFRYDTFDEEYGRMLHNGGILGLGVYLSEEWKTALWYGGLLFSISLEPHTRIIDSTLCYDEKVLRSLVSEFGKEILTAKDCTKVIPRNKKLNHKELLTLHRFLYHQVWIKEWGDSREGWPAKRERSLQALFGTVRLLKQHGYHGYGDLKSDIGVVIFAPDRVHVEKLLTDIPGQVHSNLVSDDDFKGMTLPELEKKYPPTL